MDARKRRNEEGGTACDWTCRIRPLGVDVAVGCDGPLLPLVERLLSPWAPATSPARGGVSVHITGPSANGPDRPYVLRDARSVLVTTANADELLVGLQNWLDAEVTRRATHLTAVHAGVVAWRGRAILLPGQSGAGKTTLVTALVDRGAAYYSDELALLDSQGYVFAYPRHMVVRDDRGVGRSAPPAAGTPAATPAVPVGLIADLRFEPDVSFSVDPIASSEAVLLLLANTAHRLSPSGVIPAALLRAAAAAVSYRGTRGDARAAADAILGKAWPVGP